MKKGLSSPTAKLLPAGIYDQLPPEAASKRRAVNTLMDVFAAYGYEEVSPPLIEFEDTLLSDSTPAMSRRAFRAMDPTSQKIMAIRPDITLQTARIAQTRLSGLSKPIRLSYAGDVLWVKGSSIRGERQHTQSGIELVGADGAEGDTEILLVLAAALSAIGIKKYTLDLSLPRLAPKVLEKAKIKGDEQKKKLLTALSNKDSHYIERNCDKNLSRQLLKLIESVGTPTHAAKILKPVLLTEIYKEVDEACKVVRKLESLGINANFTLDATESRGFEYHTGLSFSALVTGYPEEIGRGGRYELSMAESGQESFESATGFTLYLGHIMRILGSKEKETKKILVPLDTKQSVISDLHKKGFVTVMLGSKSSSSAARKHACGFYLNNGKVEKI